MKDKLHSRKKISSTKNRLLGVSALTLTALIAFLAGFGFQKYVQTREGKEINFAAARRSAQSVPDKRNFESRDRTPADVANEDMLYHQNAVKQVNCTSLRDYLKYFTSEPHLAGTPAGKRQAEFIKREWDGYGFDKVEIKEYDVLLSYPKSPGQVHVIDPTNNILFSAKTVEEPYFESENSNETVYPFNAYSASGDVEAEYVNVNYGDIRDYNFLKEHNISVAGKIVIGKYGKNFRGEKARIAEEYGALGLILFGDPDDTNDKHVEPYPRSWNAPAGSIPRGNIVNMKGDPLTPRYASTPGMYRLEMEKIHHLAKIPVQPISFADAERILGMMDGQEVQGPDWVGGLNITYRINSKTPRRIRLIVDTPREVRPIQNVIATIKGETEPDRYVMVGNHRDAWVFGAGDPSSGTAVLMETARIIARMLTEGWRPRRTILLCSWDAEEYGLMGSVEWGQEFFSAIRERGVVYVNVDIAVSGNYTLRAKSSATIIDKMFDVTKQMLDPDYVTENVATGLNNMGGHDVQPSKEQVVGDFITTKKIVDGDIGTKKTVDGVFTSLNDTDEGTREKSLYNNWRNKLPSRTEKNEPRYSDLGSGSDFTFFYSVLGIPSIDMRYLFDEASHKKRSQYPVYHTIYDNFNYMTTFIDPEMKYHATVTKVWLQFVLEMADDQVLHFNLTRYAKKVIKEANLFELTFKEILQPKNISLDLIKTSAKLLLDVTVDFHKRVEDVKLLNCFALRRVNDVMMSFEKAFIIPEGVLDRDDQKHIIYSPVRNSLFSRKTFPALVGLLYDIQINQADEWEHLKEQISVIAATLNNARYLLGENAAI